MRSAKVPLVGAAAAAASMAAATLTTMAIAGVKAAAHSKRSISIIMRVHLRRLVLES